MNRNRPLLIEIFDFIIKEKRWWLLPAVLGLIGAGVLVIFSQSNTVISAFIYPLF